MLMPLPRSAPIAVPLSVPFIKMHGIGNDFIVIDDLGRLPLMDPERVFLFVRKICDRKFGVGADQLLWLKRSEDPTCDVRMEIYNTDGSIAEMCGNGIRAVALYLHRHEGRAQSRYRIETLTGIQSVVLSGEDEVRVDMGPPRLVSGFETEGEKLVYDGEAAQTFFEVSMGNPHAVIFTDSIKDVPLVQIGPLIETHPRFPQRVNVGFVEVVNSNWIRLRVWERGAGPTLACGSGACAAAVTSIATGKVKSPVRVSLPGGDLTIEWQGQGTSVFMQGPAEEVFHGRYLFKV